MGIETRHRCHRSGDANGDNGDGNGGTVTPAMIGLGLSNNDLAKLIADYPIGIGAMKTLTAPQGPS